MTCQQGNAADQQRNFTDHLVNVADQQRNATHQLVNVAYQVGY
jgi:hypothetical protein